MAMEFFNTPTNYLCHKIKVFTLKPFSFAGLNNSMRR